MGKTHTLARPEVATVVNQLASISLGQSIPYATVSSAGTKAKQSPGSLRPERSPGTMRAATYTWRTRPTTGCLPRMAARWCRWIWR
jgi:hypothetical protein